MAARIERHSLTHEYNAIVSVGTHGEITIVDHAAERMFGYSHEEMLGQPVEMLLPGSHWEARVAHRPKGIALESKGRRKDGTEFPVDIAFRPIATKQGVHAAAFIADLTKKDQRMGALSESHAQLLLAREVAGLGMWNWDIAAGETHYSH